MFAGHPVEFPWSEDDPDADWRMEQGETLAGLVDEYRTAWRDGNAIAAAAPSLSSLSSDVQAEHTKGRVSLLWVYLHMIEETARHAGHADILREQIDGSTGV